MFAIAVFLLHHMLFHSPGRVFKRFFVRGVLQRLPLPSGESASESVERAFPDTRVTGDPP